MLVVFDGHSLDSLFRRGLDNLNAFTPLSVRFVEKQLVRDVWIFTVNMPDSKQCIFSKCECFAAIRRCYMPVLESTIPV